MNLNQSINRTVNLVATTIISLAGFSFLPEAHLEPELLFKVDDIVLFWIGIIAIIWYKMGKNSFKRSLIPVLFVFAGLIDKIVAIVLEIGDKEDVGDDFGALILFVLASIFVYWLYKKSASVNK